MSIRYPLPGADVEVCGVMGSFVGADVMSNGEVHFTIRCSSNNADLMETKCQASSDNFQRINPNFVTVTSSVCRWRNGPAGGLFDEDGQIMLGHSEGDVAASDDATAFQAMLSRRNMAWARSR